MAFEDDYLPDIPEEVWGESWGKGDLGDIPDADSGDKTRASDIPADKIFDAAFKIVDRILVIVGNSVNGGGDEKKSGKKTIPKLPDFSDILVKVPTGKSRTSEGDEDGMSEVLKAAQGYLDDEE